MTTKMRQFHMYLEKDQYKALEEEANRLGVSMAQVIREFIDDFLER